MYDCPKIWYLFIFLKVTILTILIRFDAFDGKKMIKFKKKISRWFSLSKILTETKSWNNRKIRTWKFNVLKSAGFKCLILQRRFENLLFFASQVFIIPISNPKHQRFSRSNFYMDLAKDKSSWTFCGRHTSYSFKLNT